MITAAPEYTNGVTVSELGAAEEQSQFYKSAVRFTRMYAMFSPTMVGLLLAKKTRYGRFIPLPDALPDDFKLGKWSFHKSADNGEVVSDYDAAVAGANGSARAAASGVNGATGKADPPAGAVSSHRVNGAGKGIATAKAVAIRAVEYEVAHQVRGRLRIRIPRLGFDAPFAERLASAVMVLPGVKRARVSKSSCSLVVEYKPKPAGSRSADTMLPQVVECIRVAAVADRTLNVTPAPVAPEAPALPSKRANAVSKMTLPALSFGLSAGMLAGLAVPPVLMGGIVLWAAKPIFGRAWQGIRDEKRLTVETLDATTIVLMVSQASFLAPSFIVSVIEGSEAARDWTARRSRQASLDLMLSLEHRAIVERDGEQAARSWDEIEIGDEILLYPGDQIPVDGLVLEGRALVDQHRNTGDSLPVLRETGDTVHAAALLVDGHLRVRAQRTGQETQAGQAVALINAAPDTDTRVSNYARKVGNWAVVPTLLVGGAVYATSGSVARTAGIVNLDLGTGMRVSSPIAVLAAQSRAARRGILIRSGRALEMLAAADVVIFDKTATLTSGHASVLHVQPLDDSLAAAEVLALASSAEQSMNHPIGEAIVRYAQGQGIEQQPVESWNFIAGLGVEAEIDGQMVRVGNSQLMLYGGVDLSAVASHGYDPHLATATRAYVSRDSELAGVIYCADPLRPESVDVIDRLQASGLETMMVSGDTQPVVDAAADKLGLTQEQVRAGLLPHDKLAAVQALQAEGRTVAVVGDGINDAGAMAHADVAISLGSASDLARETADIVLVNDDLRDLIVAIEIARHAIRILEQNKALVIVPNIGGIALGALTVMNPITALLINNGSALAAALNSLRPARQN